ncbi:MAG TPA: regulatory protein RecX [Crocinitomicaceae bacterium]|nr:regulatory protein RecX [Crocinitomicaceae bacterium]
MADIKQSIQKWCASQERSSFEVTQKLIAWRIPKDEIPHIITALRNQNFLNDERFAEDFARGKFRIKQWGRLKIRLSLQQKRVKNEYIESAISKIDEQEYIDCLRTLVIKKNALLPTQAREYERKAKLYQFLLSKGYENQLIKAIINEEIK